MSLTINMKTSAAVNGGPGVGVMTSAGNPWTVADALAQELVNRGLATPVNWTDDDLVPLSVSELAKVRAMVSEGGITDAQALAGASLSDTLGTVRTISDGANAGVRLRWYQPSDLSAPTWCWDAYPQSRYEG